MGHQTMGYWESFLKLIWSYLDSNQLRSCYLCYVTLTTGETTLRGSGILLILILTIFGTKFTNLTNLRTQSLLSSSILNSVCYHTKFLRKKSSMSNARSSEIGLMWNKETVYFQAMKVKIFQWMVFQYLSIKLGKRSEHKKSWICQIKESWWPTWDVMN